MASGITYIPTDVGWLYLVGVMDLCGNKTVGASMDGRMAKELVMAALRDAICHTQTTGGCIHHTEWQAGRCGDPCAGAGFHEGILRWSFLYCFAGSPVSALKTLQK